MPRGKDSPSRKPDFVEKQRKGKEFGKDLAYRMFEFYKQKENQPENFQWKFFPDMLENYCRENIHTLHEDFESLSVKEKELLRVESGEEAYRFAVNLIIDSMED